MSQAIDRISTRCANYKFGEHRTCGLDEAVVYLKAAQQSRLCAQAWPDLAAHYKANCRLWLRAAHAAREVESRYRRIP
jgi:hypothetical protein